MEKFEVVGNARIIEAFSRAKREGHLSGAYLLEGPAGSGKRTLARFLAALLTCSGEVPPCFACRDCENVLSGSHPDVFELIPEAGKNYISVEAARRANEEAMTAPIHADCRVFLIPGAEKMNPAAQNALLKNLEEPRSRSVYLLLAEEKGSVLPTIRSRCVIFRMELFSEERVLAYLREHLPREDAEKLKLAARLCRGAIGQALEYLGDRSAEGARKLAGDYLSALLSGADFAALSRILPPDTKKEILPGFYRLLLSGVRDVLCAAPCGAREFFPPDELLSFSGDPARLCRVAEKLCELLDPAMANVNTASAVAALNAEAAT